MAYTRLQLKSSQHNQVLSTILTSTFRIITINTNCHKGSNYLY